MKSSMELILTRVVDYQLKSSTRKKCLCSNVCRLVLSLTVPIFDSQLEISTFYAILLAAIKKGLFIIKCIEQKLVMQVDDLEPAETADLKEQKASELSALRECLAICGKLIFLHSEISMELVEDLYYNLFQKAVSDPELMVQGTYQAIEEFNNFNFCLIFKLVQATGKSFLDKMNLEALFLLCDR